MLKAHPLADIFPMMSDAELSGLVDDIKKNGLREPVVLYDGMILDGRNRYAACGVIGIEPMTQIWDGKGDPLDYVVSKNLNRRHMNESQRAMVADKIANLRNGANQHVKKGASIEAPSVSQPQAAEMLNVSRTSVQRAHRVHERGVPELQAAVRAGVVSLNAAEEISRQPQEEQRMVVAKEPKRIAEYANIIREERLQKTKGERKAKQPPWNKERHKQSNIDASVWADLKEGFEKFGNLPLASDVARIARQRDRGDLVNQRLDRTIKWLEDFRHAWNSKRDENAA